MTREEFQNIINELIGLKYNYRLAQNVPRNFLEVRWIDGGTEGTGDDRRNQAIEREPSFTELNIILEKVYPEISYLKYLRIIELTTEGSDYSSDYYGNATYYAIKRLSIDDLWEFLIEENLITTD